MDVRVCNGTTLAYIGDAVMSLWVREMLIEEGWQKPKVLQKKSEAWVSARAQAVFIDKLLKEEFFNEEEVAVVMRGRNTKTDSMAKNATMREYRMATGLEAVIGWLHLNKNQQRLDETFKRIKELGAVK